MFLTSDEDYMTVVDGEGSPIGVLGINDIRGAIELDRYKDFLSIPGIEITSKEGTHILVYFYDIGGMKSFYKNRIFYPMS